MAIIQQLLQQRHAYYRALLAVEVLALLSLRGLQQAPRLVSLVYLAIAGVGVLLDSPLLPQNRIRTAGTETVAARIRRRLRRALRRRRQLLVGWMLALLMELIWQTALLVHPELAVQLSALHLVIWLALMLQLLWGLTNALVEEPLLSVDLIIGAAAGYLLVGFTGGVVLNSLLVLDPAAFQLPADPAALHPLPAGIDHAAAMLGAAFACLTTLGSPILRNENLTSLSASVGIAIVGQLYIAILIGGVLSKPRQTAAMRKGAHRRGQSSPPFSKLRRSRR